MSTSQVDVDGPDCHLVRGLVRAGWQPKVWHVEVNPLFPPGISVWPTGTSLDSETTVTIEGLSSAFSRRVNDKQALVGCSLQALLDVAGPDYVLTHMEFENAVLVRRDISEGLEPWLSSRSPVRASRERRSLSHLPAIRFRSGEMATSATRQPGK